MGMGSRAKILQEARDLFYKNGYLATSVDDIIAAADVSKSNFYYHFKSKEDLGIAVLDSRCKEFETLLAGSLCNSLMPPRLRLKTFVEMLSGASESHGPGGCPFGNLVAEMSDHSERFRKQLSTLFCGLATVISDVIAEGQIRGEIRGDITPRDAATLLVQALQGAHLLLKCHKSRETYEFGMDLLLRLYEPGAVLNAPVSRGRTSVLHDDTAEA